MTRTADKVIACPSCGAEHVSRVFQSINLTLGIIPRQDAPTIRCRCGVEFDRDDGRFVCWAKDWKDRGAPGQLSGFPAQTIPEFLLKK